MNLPQDTSFTLFNHTELPIDNGGGSKDYDPDIYPKGTSLDIRKDKDDEDHINNFYLLLRKEKREKG